MNFRTTAFFVFLLAFLVIAQPALAYVLIDDTGNIIVVDGQVLGDDDESDDNSGSGSSGSGSSDDDDEDDDNSGSGSSGSGSSDDDDEDDDNSGSGSSGSGSSDDDDDDDDFESEFEFESEDGTVVKTEIRGDESKTEIKYADGTVVKKEVRDGETRTTVYRNGIKVRLERDGDRFRIKTENEFGEEVELGEDEIISIDERADRNRLRLRTFESSEDQLRNRAIIERLSTQALTDLPLSIDLETNELTVTTPAGERVVTVLPDQAVQNMLAANVIDRIGDEELVGIVQRSGVETLDQIIELSEENGVPVYTIQGVKEHKLLGFWNVTTNVEVTVSAETGEVLDTDQSFLDTVIDIFST